MTSPGIDVVDEVRGLLDEYEQYLSGKARGTIDAYLRTVRQLIAWLVRRPGNDGRFEPQQLTQPVVEQYLAHLEQEGLGLHHRAGEIDHQQFCTVPDRGEGAAEAQPDAWHRSSPRATAYSSTTLTRAALDPLLVG